MSCRDLIVMQGTYRATVYGCHKILLYSPCEIRLLSRKRVVSVLGEGLYCAAFSAGTVTVVGKITGVSYPSACGGSQDKIGGDL